MTDDDRLKILITEGSSGSARSTIYCLANKYEIGLLDPDLLCQCRFSRFVSRTHRCPHFASHPADFLKYLMQTVREYGYHVIFPDHEQVYLLARVRDELVRHVGVAIPSFDSIRLMQSKSDFVRTLNSLEIPVPETQIVRDVCELDSQTEYPCYIKLAHSTAGTGVALARDRNELIKAFERFDSQGQIGPGSEILIQEKSDGIMCVVQAVFQDGRLIATHCAESLEQGVGGGQGYRVSASHPAVVQYVRQLGESLNWHGAMFLEYFYDQATGHPEFIECNPRIGETYNAFLCGINLSELVVRISLGQQLEPINLPVKTGVRSHTDFFVLLRLAMRGASRRRIIGEAWNMLTKSNRYRDSVSEVTRISVDYPSVIPAIATVSRLVFNPKLAQRIVEKAVRSYSLPQYGVENIHSLSDDALLECLQ